MSKSIGISETVRQGLRTLRSAGGFSVCLQSGRFADHDSGYMVSLRGLEMRLSDVMEQALQERLLEQYLATVAVKHGGQAVMHYWGGWRSGGFSYFDVSIHIESRGEAVSMALRHGQEAIYDCKRCEVF